MKKFLLYSGIALLAYLPQAGMAQSSSDAQKPSDSRISLQKEKTTAIAWDFVHAITVGNTEKVSKLLAPTFMRYGPGAEDVANTGQYFAIWKERYKDQEKRRVEPISTLGIESLSGELKGEWVMLWFDYHAVVGSKKVAIKVPIHITMRLVNDKIIELHEYFDTGSLMKKLEQTN